MTKGNQTLHLTSLEQSSYVRSMCLVTKHLIGQLTLNPFFEAILDSDLLNLERYHGQTGFTVRFTRRETLKVIVPSSHVLSSKPLSVRIDFDHLRRTMEKTYSVGAGGRLYFSVEIIVASGEREATWDLPIEAVPSGIVTLQEGEANYDRFLHLTIA